MFYIKDTYAKVWKTVRTEEKYIDLNITTSEKDQEGNYINSGWFIRCVGAAYNKAKKLGEGARIKILKGKITNERRKTEDNSFKPYGADIRIMVFDFDVVDQGNSYKEDEEETPKKTTKKKASTKKESTKKKQEIEDEEEDDDDLDIPF